MKKKKQKGTILYKFAIYLVVFIHFGICVGMVYAISTQNYYHEKYEYPSTTPFKAILLIIILNLIWSVLFTMATYVKSLHTMILLHLSLFAINAILPLPNWDFPELLLYKKWTIILFAILYFASILVLFTKAKMIYFYGSIGILLMSVSIMYSISTFTGYPISQQTYQRQMNTIDIEYQHIKELEKEQKKK